MPGLRLHGAVGHWLPLALLPVWGCAPTSMAPPPDHGPAAVRPLQPSAAPSPSVPRCSLDGLPRHAKVASRELQADTGLHGPWFVGESVFEYLKPSPRDGNEYVNRGTRGGRSKVALGPPLEVVMPANEGLPADSLLRFGPPAAIAFRVETSGDYRIAVVACGAPEVPAPALDVETLGDSVDAITTLSEEQLMYVGAPTRPSVEAVWTVSTSEIAAGFTAGKDVHLNAGDVVRLTAVGVPQSGTVLRMELDFAIWSLPAVRGSLRLGGVGAGDDPRFVVRDADDVRAGAGERGDEQLGPG